MAEVDLKVIIIDTDPPQHFLAFKGIRGDGWIEYDDFGLVGSTDPGAFYTLAFARVANLINVGHKIGGIKIGHQRPDPGGLSRGR